MRSLKHTLTQFILTVCVVNALSATSEAACNASMQATSPTWRFINNNDGTITDVRTGLMWMRCALGQTWDGTTCTGTATKFTWGDGLTAADPFAFATHTDWRLPNVKELISIVERSCADPSINSTIFPETPASGFWTSSPSVQSFATDAKVINFSLGMDRADAKTNVDSQFQHYVRLVRTVRE